MKYRVDIIDISAGALSGGELLLRKYIEAASEAAAREYANRICNSFVCPYMPAYEIMEVA